MVLRIVTESGGLAFEHIFGEYGLPRAILSDNGSAIGSPGLALTGDRCKQVFGFHLLPTPNVRRSAVSPRLQVWQSLRMP